MDEQELQHKMSREIFEFIVDKYGEEGRNGMIFSCALIDLLIFMMKNNASSIDFLLKMIKKRWDILSK